MAEAKKSQGELDQERWERTVGPWGKLVVRSVDQTKVEGMVKYLSDRGWSIVVVASKYEPEKPPTFLKAIRLNDVSLADAVRLADRDIANCYHEAVARASVEDPISRGLTGHIWGGCPVNEFLHFLAQDLCRQRYNSFMWWRLDNKSEWRHRVHIYPDLKAGVDAGRAYGDLKAEFWTTWLELDSKK